MHNHHRHLNSATTSELLASAVVAARIGKPAPSLLPEVATSCAQKDLLKAA